MWTKTKNPLSPNYITVENKSSDLHIYVTGTNVSDVNNVSEAIEDLLNHNTKSRLLKVNINMEELVLLRNGVRVGVAGQVKQIKRNLTTGDITHNEDRCVFLREIVNKF